ncbi:MAG: hypothetical protein V1800_03860 [Candidatus Latescibacterota bacterium]
MVTSTGGRYPHPKENLPEAAKGQSRDQFAVVVGISGRTVADADQTFEECCRKRWDFASNYARRLITSVETVDNVKNVPTGTIPTSERQARSLANLEPQQQIVAWLECVVTEFEHHQRYLYYCHDRLEIRLEFDFKESGYFT